MRILITTMLEDIHAIAVTAVLRNRGHDVVTLHHADFPTRQNLTMEFGMDPPRLMLQGAGLEACDPRAFDVVWNRRHMTPLADDRIAAEDRAFVCRETRAASNAFWQLTGSESFWINPEPAAQRAESKPLQLSVASRLGMTLPPTLISNDPVRVRDFVAEQNDACIYKPFTFLYDWKEHNRVHALYTSSVNSAQLPSDRLLAACPGIYQRRVDKCYEVRATFMGHHCAAIAIDSQQTERGQVDWRRAQIVEKMPARSIEVPLAVQESCWQLMSELGLVFGCFDFIVTNDERWVFLEVNQTGQFLFIEYWCPELPMLDMFCTFIASRDPHFSYVQPPDPIRVNECVPQVLIDSINEAERAVHLDPGPPLPLVAIA